MIEFTSFQQHKSGLVVSLLSQSYAEYFQYEPGYERAWLRSWEEYDRQVFQNPDEIGSCGFVTWVDGRIVGFASWDPRRFPEAGIIGHNCVLPAFRGNSHGKRQIVEILRILKESGFKKAFVTTGEHRFFTPAQRMYRSCGFQEVKRGFSDPHSKFRTIDYELSLSNRFGPRGEIGRCHEKRSRNELRANDRKRPPAH
jgi:GNAT superfamily N-acetyltransferase